MWIRRKYSWYFRQKEFVRSVHHPRFFCFSIFFSFFYFLCVYFCLRSFRSTQTERRVNVGGETRKQLLWLHCFFFLLYVCVFIVSVFLLPFFVLFCTKNDWNLMTLSEPSLSAARPHFLLRNTRWNWTIQKCLQKIHHWVFLFLLFLPLSNSIRPRSIVSKQGRCWARKCRLQVSAVYRLE